MRRLPALLLSCLAACSGGGGGGDPKPADPCDPSPCFAGVACTATGATFACGACPAGYEGNGVTCADVNGCAGNPCAPGVTCADVPAPGAGFTCGACPPGQAGDGITCVEADGCAGNPCLATTTCTDVPAPGTGYTCSACTAASCPIFRALAGPDKDAVAGAEVTLTAEVLGNNGAYTCAWTATGAAALAGCVVKVSPAATTEYTLTVTDASARTASDAVVVRVAGLLADAGPTRNVPAGGSTTLTATWSGASCADGACVTCAWKDSAGISVANTCSTDVSPAVTTAYTLTVTDGGNGRTAADTTTVFVLGEPARLCGWDVVVMTSNEYPTAANPNYLCDANQIARRQTVNGKPAVVLSDLVVGNAKIVGYISVETSADDDLIGFLWGWQNPKHAYLLTWKQLSQNWTAACGNAPAGIAVKKLDGAAASPATVSFNASFGFNATDYAYSCADLWSQSRANDALLRDDTIFLLAPQDAGGYTGGWADFTTYRFEFYYTPSRTKVLVYSDDAATGSTANLLTSFTVEDSSYPEGKFAFFSNSQEQVAFGNYTLASLDGFAANAGPDQTVAPGGTAQLTGTAELAVPPYTCTWKDAGGATAGTACALGVMPAATTTYTLTVTDAFGRATSDAVTVNVGT
ncbi:MAG: hypothetical protein U0229_08305 [Anaeromyxobacter sp.]